MKEFELLLSKQSLQGTTVTKPSRTIQRFSFAPTNVQNNGSLGRTGGVWDARALYYSIMDDYIAFEMACSAQGRNPIHKGNKLPPTPSDNYNLFPNPNSGEMTLTYHLQDGETGIFSIYDITGKLISRHNLNSSVTSINIEESTLDAGIYFYEIKVNDRKVKMDKLIIIK